MTISLKHAFTSAKADGPDATLIRPSNWNAEHVLTQATATMLGRVTAGTGVTEELTAAQVRTFLNVADGAQAVNATTVASAIVSASAKTTPVDADTFSIIDSAASNALKELTWANLKAALRATETNWTAVQTFVTTGNFSAPLVIEGQNSAHGPALNIQHVGGSPAVSDIIGGIAFIGQNTALGLEDYGGVRCLVSDLTPNAEYSYLSWRIMSAGATLTRMALTTEGLAVNVSYTVQEAGAAFTADGYYLLRRNTDGWLFKHERTDDAAACGLYASGHSGSVSLNFYYHGGNYGARLNSSGAFQIGTTDGAMYNNTSAGQGGINLFQSGSVDVACEGTVFMANRIGSDGYAYQVFQNGVSAGGINVAGGVVSIIAGHLTRFTQWEGAHPVDVPPLGTVLSNAETMCEWKEVEFQWLIPGNEGADGAEPVPDKVVTKRQLYFGLANVGDVIDYEYEGQTVQATVLLQENMQLNRMIVSDVPGDRNVAGILERYDEDGEPICAMSGDLVIRIDAGVTVAMGDLLESAGNGCARPQSDDIIRSKTIAKVNSSYVARVYPDGSYLVPCTLLCGG